MPCEVSKRLQRKAIACLAKMNDLTYRQMKCLQDGNTARAYQLDRQLDITFGEKERAFGALKEHAEEHQC